MNYGGERAYWLESPAAPPAYPALDQDLQVDVAVVGAGIVGITTALLLRRAGLSVALLEARRAAGQVSGHTTAKVTSLHGLVYADLIDAAGEDVARTYGQSNEAALQLVADLVDEYGIACGFERTAAYTYCTGEAELGHVRREAEAALKLGLPAQFTAESSLPFPIAGAVRFSGQAQFHPREYLLALLRHAAEAGVRVYEHSRVTAVDDGAPCKVTTRDGNVTATHVVIATCLPILDRGGYFATAYPYTHAVLAARLASEGAFDGMYRSVEAPTRSVRLHRSPDGPVLIATGEGFKTGQGDPLDALAGLEDWARRHFPVDRVLSRWSNEDFNSMDRRPYIGRLSSRTDTLWTATGFSAWGMTGGTLAAVILRDRIMNVDNPWASIYDTTRLGLRQGGGGAFLRENVNVAARWTADHLGKADRRAPDQLAPGEAAILKPGKQAIAAWRDDDGQVHAVSASCTHMGCLVHWNGLSRSWDCPCHGSRFAPDGEVLYGPAVEPLQRVEPVAPPRGPGQE